MVGVFAEPGFFARKFLKMTFGRFRATFLQALTQCLMPCTNTFNRLPTEGFPLRVSSQVDDTQINPEGVIGGSRGRGWNVKGYRKIEGPIAVKQVSLSLDTPGLFGLPEKLKK